MKGFTHLMEHCIDTSNSTPISTRPSMVSYKERVFIQDLVQNMLNDGIIEKAKIVHGAVGCFWHQSRMEEFVSALITVL